MKPLRTSDVARAAGIHPNTVRLYEEHGLLPPADRLPNGYRAFTPRHVDQAVLVVELMRCSWTGGVIRQAALDTARHAARGDFPAARRCAADMLARIAEERRRAERAADLLTEWATAGGASQTDPGETARTPPGCAASRDQEDPAPGAEPPDGMTIREAAAFLNVTPHTLRNWDRNRLLTVPRHPSSGYRVYGPAELRRLAVIRALRRAGYNVMTILHMFRQLEADHAADPHAAIDSVPPGEPDIFRSTYRWLSKTRELEACARAAVARLEEMAQRYGPAHSGTHRRP